MAGVTITVDVRDAKLAADLAEVAGRGGPVPLDDLVRLAGLYAGVRSEQVLDDASSAARYIPDLVDLGGLRLRRPSLGALMIIERAVQWNVTDRWSAVHTACVLHNVDNPEALAALARLETADGAVADFAPKCRFTEAAWRRALVVLVEGIAEDADAQKKTQVRTTPDGACACIPGGLRDASPARPAEPRDIGCGRCPRARRWLRGAMWRAAAPLRWLTPWRNGRSATPRRSDGMSGSSGK